MASRRPWGGRNQRNRTEQVLKLKAKKTFLKYFPECFELEVGRAHHFPKETDPELPTPGHFLGQFLDFREQ